MPVTAIVPAAGRASRFGGGKLTADLDGQPLLNHTLRSLLDAGIERVVVVVAPDAELATVPLFDDPRVTRVTNPDPSRGMFSSIQAGVAASEGDPILVLPADMPFVTSETVADVAGAGLASGRIVSPIYRGRHGHPVALPGRLRDKILEAPPESTLAELIERHTAERTDIDVDDPGIARDVDVPGDLG